MNIIYKPINFLIKKTKAYQDIYKELDNIKKHLVMNSQEVTICNNVRLYVPDHLQD